MLLSFDFHDPQLSTRTDHRVANSPLGQVEFAESGSGPAVVAVHGAMGGYDQSLILAQTIGFPGYRYIAMSRPGYLGTPISSGKTPQQQGDLIAALLDSLGIGQAGVMAVSGGGPSAVEFGLRHPERCKGLILVSTCADKVPVPIPISFRIMMLLARWPWFVNRLRRQAERDLVAVLKRSISDPEVLERTTNDAHTWPIVSTMLLSMYYRMGERLVGTDKDIEISRTATYPLENLSVPVLVIHGTDDRLVNFDHHARMYERRVPNVELLAIEGGEHVAIFTHRAIVSKKVSEFMLNHFAVESGGQSSTSHR